MLSDGPSLPPSSSLSGAAQVAVLTGYDDKAKLVELSPAVLHTEGGTRYYQAIAGVPTFKYPLSNYVTILSAKTLCPGGKPDGNLLGTTPCTVDQLIVALMTHPHGADPIAAQVVVDPYGEITKIAEAE
jgi:hypothetical protein